MLMFSVMDHSSNSTSTLSFMAEFAHHPLQSLFLLSYILGSSPVVLDYLHSSIQIVRIEDSRLYLFSFYFILDITCHMSLSQKDIEGSRIISRSLTVNFILFFLFILFYFTLLYFFLFLFLEQLGLGFISHAVTSVTN